MSKKNKLRILFWVFEFIFFLTLSFSLFLSVHPEINRVRVHLLSTQDTIVINLNKSFVEQKDGKIKISALSVDGKDYFLTLDFREVKFYTLSGKRIPVSEMIKRTSFQPQFIFGPIETRDEKNPFALF